MPRRGRVVHFEKEDVFRTLDAGEGGTSFPTSPHTGTGGTSGPKPPQPVTIGISFPQPVQPVAIVHGSTSPVPGFVPSPEWATTVTYNPNQSVSIAAQEAIDPFETAILPEWLALYMPFELGEQARWRYEVLREQHPDWTDEQISQVLFGEAMQIPGSGLVGANAQLEQNPWLNSSPQGFSQLQESPVIPLPAPYHPAGPGDYHSGLIGSVISAYNSVFWSSDPAKDF